MGGMGSGRRWYNSGKDTTTSYRRIDVRRWQRDSGLVPGQTYNLSWSHHGATVASIRVKVESQRVILSYRMRQNGGEWREMEYPVHIEWTPCHYGGRRAWFRCPAVGCGRRVALLYMSSIFACRHCLKLGYASQQENPGGRAILRADKIRRRLGWQPGVIHGIGNKPKGMHWKTYMRLCQEHLSLTHAWAQDAARRYKLVEYLTGKVTGRLGNK